MMDPVYSQPRSRSSSQGSSSGQSVILNTPRDPSPEEKTRHKEREEFLSDGSPLQVPRLPEIGYELPYDDLHPSELGRQRQVPPHRSLPAPTYEVVSNPILPDGAPCLVVRFKRATRVFWAEFFGTAILALFGTAANCQVALSNSNLVTSSPAGTYLSVAFGWALAVMLGVFVSAGISGGHINPAVTLSLAIFRRFPWYKVPVYWLAQISGAVAGSGLTYLNYSSALNLFEGGHGVRNIEKTGGLFFTSALPYASNYLCFYNEVLMTAILMIFVVAVGDQGNTSPPKNMGPFVIFWVVLGLASTLGMQTSFALNPARDLGPRIVTWLAGYGSAVWSVRSNYWFSVAILGPGFGAIVGCFIYDFFIATEKVTDCALHQPRDIGALMKKFRDITPIKDPEQTNLTKFVRQRPSRLEFPTGRRAPAAMNEDSVTGSARTTSHRYTNLTRG
ncbi:hypothetical protein MJO28_014749 [Puccinia striiformis f. sp. tritici]|uniref:Uncharacterized protein n=1 Tax=Puccinia striiformis f. sp. tritici TaxID=168172 RepID=A0ACC0DUC8_9BASI|nr:hypothetical protein Pst134EA_027103 [Puccinia striiformis f. sp. tritici]KAH9443292.1 hypothetical protein Pst134EB_027639 [Puccinia striiformis f. sp. tritici]KAH9450400.1 hypothetical protein Pst134EA_027103 [Puccinia striiformis f. sp. tritici]KAI7939170.1 hypothetical protein MJO28_014749 [Puccinia striiformis f. sp. tritici]